MHRFEPAVDRPGSREPRGLGVEDVVVDEAVEAVEERGAGGLDGRGGPVRGQLRHVTGLEEAVGTGLRVGDLGQHVPPVGRAVRIRHAEHAVDLRSVPLAGHVHAGISQAPGHGDLHGRQLEESGPTLVRRIGGRLHHGQHLRAEADARDLVAVEDAGHAAAQDVDRGDERDAQPLRLAPADELVQRARVPAHLADGERGPGANLEGQLQELRDEVRFERLEGVDGSARGEVQAVRRGVAEERQEAHRVDVEDRARAPVVAVLGEVAGEGQHVGEPLAGEAVGQRLQGGAIALSTGDVDEDLAAHVVDGVAQRQRAEADVATGVVRDGDGGDPLVGRQVAGLGAQPLAGVVLDGARPRHELGQDEAAVGTGKGIAEAGHVSDGTEVVAHPDGPLGTFGRDHGRVDRPCSFVLE